MQAEKPAEDAAVAEVEAEEGYMTAASEPIERLTVRAASTVVQAQPKTLQVNVQPG